MFYLHSRFPPGAGFRLDYFAVKVIVNKQWCVYYFTKVSRGRLPTKQSRFFVDEEQAATVTHISKIKGNVDYLDSDSGTVGFT